MVLDVLSLVRGWVVVGTTMQQSRIRDASEDRVIYPWEWESGGQKNGE